MSVFDVFNYNPPPPPPAQKVKKSNEVNYTKNPTKLFKRVEGKAWESAIERISTNQIEPRIWVVKKAFDGSLTWRRLPLHEACIRKPTPALIHKLLQSYPRAALKPDSDGRLPLHHACANNASLDVVEKLIMVYPESMDVQDKWNKTPIQTLMATYFPDPHVISALKKDVHYYKKMALEESQNAKSASDVISPIRATPSTETMDFPTAQSLKSTSGETNSSPFRNSRQLSPTRRPQLASQSFRSEARGVVNDPIATDSPVPVDRSDRQKAAKDAAMTSALEDEIGRFSKKLASSINKENSMQKKIHSLETEVNRLLVIENDNNRLKGDINDLENELRMAKGTLDREREENFRDLQMIEEMRRSEDNLKKQIDEMNHDPRQRMLEDKVSSLVDALDERDERHKMEVQNLQRAFRNVEEDAAASHKIAGQLEDENNKLSLELKRLEYQLSSQRDSEQQMIEKLNESKHLSMEMEMLERRCKDQDKKLSEVTQKLNMVEEENNNLRHDRTELSRLQIKYRSQEDHLHELDDQLRRAKDEVKRMGDQMSGKDRDVEHQKMSISSEKKKFERRIEELLEDLKRSEKKNSDTMRDKADLESKMKMLRMSLRQVTQERDDLEKQEVAINTELSKIQRTLDVKIGEYKQKLLDEQAKATASSEKCNLLEDEVRKLRETINETSALNAEAMRESMKLREIIKDRDMIQDKIERENRELEERLAHVEGGKEKYKRKAHDAQSKLKESDQAKAALDNEKRLFASEKEKFQTEKLELIGKVSSLNKEVHEARSQLSIAVIKESDFLSKLDQARNEMTHLKNRVDNAEREKNAVEMNMKDFEHKHEVLARDKRNIEAEKSQLVGQMALMKVEVQKMGALVENRENERDQGMKKLNEQQDESKRQREALEDIIVDLEKQISSMRKMNTERDIEIRKLLEQQDGSRRQKDVLEGQKFDLEKQLSFMRNIRGHSGNATSDRDAEIKRLRDELVKSNRAKQSLEEKVADLESQISFMKMEAEWKEEDSGAEGGNRSFAPTQQERKVKKLSVTIQELTNERDKLQKKLDRTEDDNNILRRMMEQSDDLSELAELTERLENVEEEKDSEISCLMEEREELRQEVARLEEKVLSLENELKKMSTTSEISKLKALRDKKKKNLSRRLAAYENRISSGGTVVSTMSVERRARDLRDLDDDAMSVFSGVTLGSRLQDTEKISKWKSKYRNSPRVTKKDGNSPEHPLLSPLSDGESSIRSKKQELEQMGPSLLRKMGDSHALEYMFPSTMSVTGLSIDASERSLRKKDGVPKDVTIATMENRVPSVILEDRNGSECGSRS